MIRWEKPSGARQNRRQAQIDDDCHVSYKDTGVNPKNYCYAPGQILCLLTPEPGVYQAVVKCCEVTYTRSSIFSTSCKQAYGYSSRSEKHPYICHVDMESIVRPILMIPREDNEGIVYDEIWDPTLWADEFSS